MRKDAGLNGDADRIPQIASPQAGAAVRTCAVAVRSASLDCSKDAEGLKQSVVGAGCAGFKAPESKTGRRYQVCDRPIRLMPPSRCKVRASYIAGTASPGGGLVLMTPVMMNAETEAKPNALRLGELMLG